MYAISHGDIRISAGEQAEAKRRGGGSGRRSHRRSRGLRGGDVYARDRLRSDSDISVGSGGQLRGGKVAIDFGGAKNMVGSFYQPDIVLADTGALATLPERQFRAGMAEVVKYAAIADESLINTIESGDVAQMVTRCVQIKADVVEQDPLDKGVRALLNFGHTAGHSVESLSDFSLLHGEAVAVGMSIMTRVGEYMGETETGTAERLDAIMKAQGLDTRCSYSAEDIVAQMGMDKKAEADGVRAVLISRIGDAHTRHMTSEEMLGYVRRALEAQKKD